ncbi:MAG: hypothetical protein ACKV22_29925 [Bryobacteraceae bacterium]
MEPQFLRGLPSSRVDKPNGTTRLMPRQVVQSIIAIISVRPVRQPVAAKFSTIASCMGVCR